MNKEHNWIYLDDAIRNLRSDGLLKVDERFVYLLDDYHAFWHEEKYVKTLLIKILVIDVNLIERVKSVVYIDNESFIRAIEPIASEITKKTSYSQSEVDTLVDKLCVGFLDHSYLNAKVEVEKEKENLRRIEEERSRFIERQREIEMFNHCVSIADYYAYLSRYSDGEYRYEAIAAIRKIELEEKRKEEERNKKLKEERLRKEDDAFFYSCTTKENFNNYLFCHPNGRHTHEARTKVMEYESAERQNEIKSSSQKKNSNDLHPAVEAIFKLLGFIVQYSGKIRLLS